LIPRKIWLEQLRCFSFGHELHRFARIVLPADVAEYAENKTLNLQHLGANFFPRRQKLIECLRTRLAHLDFYNFEISAASSFMRPLKVFNSGINFC
jgi:hypothetical protein